MTTYTLTQHLEPLAVVQLPPGTDLPNWVSSSTFLSITATAEETSIVCAAEVVPQGITKVGPWVAFEVAGPLDFALTGVLYALLEPLATASISIFEISTFYTDWILVPSDDADRAADEWRRQGHRVAPTSHIAKELS